MSPSLAVRPTRAATAAEHSLIEQAFSRTAGAPVISGNHVRLLKDAAENYPAWLDAIRAAERYVYFESYIIWDDNTGALFADALKEKAREGVRVRLVYDWLGGLGKTSRRFWDLLRTAGVDVRGFNPPRPGSPFGWLHRDHRKMLSVDGRVGFVAGLCVGDPWVGDPARNIDPWRDTGVEIRGPAVADVERAFANVWAAGGTPIPDGERVIREEMTTAGDMALRVVAGEPFTAGVLRLDQFIAAATRETLWLTDAYFAGTPPYVQALRAAARDGVDVRLLVPGGTDIAILRPLSRAGYRPLLQAGVRVFEWKGPMLHAKTAVADGKWARVGSSNLNLASWLGNYELDVVVEDHAFAGQMQRMYLNDLENATEIVLAPGIRRFPAQAPVQSLTPGRPADSRAGGNTGRAAAGAVRLGNAIGAAITDHRVLEPGEGRLIASVGFLLLAVAVIGIIWPRVIMVPFAVFGVWVGGALLAKGLGLHRKRSPSASPQEGVVPHAPREAA